jgi:hypothetical protein
MTNISTDISSRALLVDLDISSWSARKYDRSISKEVSDQHGVSLDSGNYNKALLAKEAMKEITSAISQARTTHESLTLPWMNYGARILASCGYFNYTEKMRQCQMKLDEALANFYPVYPQLVEERRLTGNGFFKAEDYPPLDILKRKFRFNIAVLPVPTQGDFRVDLSPVDVERIRAEIDANVRDAIQETMKEPWRRLKDVISHMAERLRLYQVTEEGVQNKFHNTLVTNLTDLLDLMPSLNITNDTALNTFCAVIRKNLSAYPADVLRENDAVRISVATAADNILSAMEAFVA